MHRGPDGISEISEGTGVPADTMMSRVDTGTEARKVSEPLAARKLADTAFVQVSPNTVWGENGPQIWHGPHINLGESGMTVPDGNVPSHSYSMSSR